MAAHHRSSNSSNISNRAGTSRASNKVHKASSSRDNQASIHNRNSSTTMARHSNSHSSNNVGSHKSMDKASRSSNRVKAMLLEFLGISVLGKELANSNSNKAHRKDYSNSRSNFKDNRGLRVSNSLRASRTSNNSNKTINSSNADTHHSSNSRAKVPHFRQITLIKAPCFLPATPIKPSWHHLSFSRLKPPKPGHSSLHARQPSFNSNGRKKRGRSNKATSGIRLTRLLKAR